MLIRVEQVTVMIRLPTIVMVVVLVIGSVSAFPMAAAAQSDAPVAAAIGQSPYAQETTENASENASDVEPGERLSGVVGLVQAEFEGEIELRTYGIEFARASTANAKADVVKEHLVRIEARLMELEERKQALSEARENGEISEGQFRARMTELAARTETLEQMANASEARADSLPDDLLRSKGINVSAIRALKMNAEELSGGEVAAIARSIAGDVVGQSISQGPPAEIGVPGPGQAGDGEEDDASAEARAAIDRAGEQLDAAETRLEQAEERLGPDASENATLALERARTQLEAARAALEGARSALEVGNQNQAMELAETALSHAEQAESHAQEALDEAQSGQDSGQTDDGQDGSDQSAEGDY